MSDVIKLPEDVYKDFIERLEHLTILAEQIYYSSEGDDPQMWEMFLETEDLKTDVEFHYLDQKGIIPDVD